jgi:hypothetical protein
VNLDQQNIYWVFSSSAQSVSAFIAFLLTGYAFVHTVMESIQQRDDSLLEVHHELRRQYYFRLRVLSAVTGCAIVTSLVMVYFNGVEIAWKPGIAIGTATLNLLAIIGGLLFVLSIVDPDKYKKIALKLAVEEHATTRETKTAQNATVFFDEFVRLERLVRAILEQRDVVAPRDRRQFSSFRDAVILLYKNELIPRDLFDELLEISKYRNLVFHGQLHKVDERLIERVRNARAKLEQL